VILLHTRSEGLLDFHRAFFVAAAVRAGLQLHAGRPGALAGEPPVHGGAVPAPLGACGCDMMAAVLAAAAAMMAVAAMAAKASHEDRLSCSAIKYTKLAYLANALTSDMQTTRAVLFPPPFSSPPRISEQPCPMGQSLRQHNFVCNFSGVRTSLAQIQ